MPGSLHRLSTLALASAAFVACSNSENVGYSADAHAGTTGKDAPTLSWGDGATANRDASPFCFAVTQACTGNSECCSGICDPASATCVTSINACTPTGGGCLSATECCSLSCMGGRCSAGACVADGQACTDGAACCSGACSGGLCQPLNTTCSTAGNPCSANTQCCSQLCDGGVCKLGASFCIQTGDVCSDSSTCCSGDCLKAAGSTLGTCAAPPSGATYCSDGVDGTVCGDCNNCCSRVCAPYGPSGVRVCQPASGCRVNGDLCRKDGDCCGAAGTGLPGEGNVVCDVESGKTLGICRNPRSCNPQGNVCHYKNYTCSVSSARNDCCACISGKECCQLDFMGVPRCNALAACVPGGGICSSTMDCCNQMPCIPDVAGLLRCYLPPGSTIDGGVMPPSSCVPSGGPCTINADCCVGVVCIEPQGSTQGICGLPTTPPAKPGWDGGTDATAPTCAEYGQQCKVAADCCNSIPCTAGRCVTEFNIP